MPKEERVNHPQHYQTGGGIEVIDVIRHYTCDIANALKYLMRAGRKQEADMTDREKEIEDLRKALWYIEDYRTHLPNAKKFKVFYGSMFVKETIGYDMDEVAAPYCEDIRWAIECTMLLGIIREGRVYAIDDYHYYVTTAIDHIQQRIASLEAESSES